FTGTKDIIYKVDKGMVVQLDPMKLAKKIMWYFSINNKKKRTLSKKFRDKAIRFNKKDYISEFRKNFYEALKL
ncbi:MAG: hypothetical protein QXV17_13945, partial [Candidatus Micrarchaeaceae archaeon]